MISAIEPLRPLGAAGRALWSLALGADWLTDLDVEMVQITAEQQDERVALRLAVFQAKQGHVVAARRALRELDRALAQNLVMLGLAGKGTGDGSLVADSLSGDRRDTLMAIANRLARSLDTAPDTVAVQIAAQLRATLAELDDISSDGESSFVDDLAKKRDARIAAAEAAVASP